MQPEREKMQRGADVPLKAFRRTLPSHGVGWIRNNARLLGQISLVSRALYLYCSNAYVIVTFSALEKKRKRKI